MDGRKPLSLRSALDFLAIADTGTGLGRARMPREKGWGPSRERGASELAEHARRKRDAMRAAEKEPPPGMIWRRL